MHNPASEGIAVGRSVEGQDQDITTVVVSGHLVGVPTKSAIQAGLRYLPKPLNEDQLAQVQLYIGTLLFWNHKISLTSLTEPPEILTRHFGESFLALEEIAEGHTSMVDLGSGAGFPGVVLKIARPALRLHLVEQNAKKAAFLSEIARVLELKDVIVHRLTYQKLPSTISGLDLVVSRALGGYKDALLWSSERLARPSGKAMLWIGSEEARRLSNVPGWRVLKIIPVPDALHRVIFIACPT